jgi:glycerol-3-phosphate dehydrogenase
VRPLTFDPDQPMGRRTREIHDLTAIGMPRVLAMTAGPVQSYMSAGRELHRAVARLLPTAGRRAVVSPAYSRRVAALGDDRAALAETYKAAVLHEHARDLCGILRARASHAWGRHVDRDVVDHAAQSVASLLGWSPEQTAREVDDFLRHQSRHFPKGHTA